MDQVSVDGFGVLAISLSPRYVKSFFQQPI